MRFLNSYAKRLTAGVLVVLAVMIPVAVSAAEDVKLDGSVGVANVTAGDKQYAQAVNAKYNEVIKVQVYYHNTEDAASDKTAQKVRVKVDVPTAAGKSQTVTSTIKGDNTNAVNGQVSVNLENDNATIQYIPGSAVWRHNASTNNTANFVEEKISDEVVSGAQGLVLEDEKPGDDHASTVTILARVMVPGIKLTKQVELASESGKWAPSNTAKAGDTLKYLVSYQNIATTTQNKVVVRDILPNHISIVPGTTTLTNTSNPKGVVIASDDIAKGGINIGNYAAGANAYITFQAKVDSADKLACGANDLRAVSGIQPENTSEFFGSSLTSVNRDCGSASPAPTPTPTSTPPPVQATPTPTPTPTPQQASPVYSCDNLTVTKGDNRKITAKVDYTAKNGASYKTITYNFGDGSQALTTDKNPVDYTYKKDGDYTVTVTLLMSVNGKDQIVTSATCAKPVSFAAATTPTAPSTPAPTPAAGAALPSTGPGDVIGIFAAATVVGALLHRYVIRRFMRS